MTRGGPREASPSADVEVFLLGGFTVRVAGRPVPDRWRLRKAKTLVKLLALADGHRMHRDDLAARLWPDLAAPAAANNVHQALHAARRALAAAGASSSVLELRDEVVALCPGGGLHVDALAFEDAVRRAVDGGLDEMRQALDLWAGEPLPEDRYAGWATDARDRLIEQWAGLTARMAEALAGIGEGDAAVALVAPLAAGRPLDEHVQRAMMTALAAAGRHRDALDVYDQLHEVLDRELAAEPERETRRVRGGILSATAPTPGAGSSVRSGVPSPTTSFVGRAREIAALDAELDTSRLVTLTGPAGAGKTRVAVELARRRAGAGRHPDGVHLVELAGVREPDLVVSAVASALGLRAHGTSPPDRIADQLGERDVLLVLDNAEHLLRACARLTTALLAGCARLTVLTTSAVVKGRLGHLLRRYGLSCDNLHPPPNRMVRGMTTVQRSRGRRRDRRPGPRVLTNGLIQPDRRHGRRPGERDPVTTVMRSASRTTIYGSSLPARSLLHEHVRSGQEVRVPPFALTSYEEAVGDEAVEVVQRSVLGQTGEGCVVTGCDAGMGGQPEPDDRDRGPRVAGRSGFPELVVQERWLRSRRPGSRPATASRRL